MGLDTTAIGIYAAIGCYFAICANRKLSTRSFDGTIRSNDGIVLAHFDAIFIHGDLIITIYLQYQFVHILVAVVFNHGNHTVFINFEVILVGLFASSCFSRNSFIDCCFRVRIGDAIPC